MDNGRRWGQDSPKSYALTGKIMLSAIVILFAVVVFIVVLHLYARWYLLRLRQRSLHHRRRSRRQRAAHVVFYVDPNNNNPAVSVPVTRGLDASVLSSLPVFAYSSRTHPAALECAVCLSEFEEGENGRVLPKCQHSFHIDCIDMWFQSHSTCPICRSPVEPQDPVKAPTELVVSLAESTRTEPGSSSGLCTCQQGGGQPGTTSLADRRKGLDLVGVTIEVPRRGELEEESRLSSPVSQGFRSPASRLMSLKRILSMGRKTPAASPSSGVGSSGGVGTESDIELGKEESTQGQTRAHTPS